jgi:hypothetical protein
MKDDERLDTRIRELASDLNTPPPTPRGEMWERIRAERALHRQRPDRGMTERVRWAVWVVGIAATLAVGVALGRLSMRPEGVVPPTVASDTGAGGAEGISAAYRLATAEHLGRVETFLTVFTAEAPGGQVSAADFETPARQLLLRTRLLRQSPVTTGDVVLQTLLDDVELVLLQIATFAQVDDQRELDFVEQGIIERSVMLRLRSALPNAAQWRTAGGSL